jgi:hypothetical protein
MTKIGVPWLIEGFLHPHILSEFGVGNSIDFAPGIVCQEQF